MQVSISRIVVSSESHLPPLTVVVLAAHTSCALSDATQAALSSPVAADRLHVSMQ